MNIFPNKQESDYFQKVYQFADKLSSIVETDGKKADSKQRHFDFRFALTENGSQAVTAKKVISKALELLTEGFDYTWEEEKRPMLNQFSQNIERFIKLNNKELQNDEVANKIQNAFHVILQSLTLNNGIQKCHLDSIVSKAPDSAFTDDNTLRAFLSLAAFEAFFFDKLGKMALAGIKGIYALDKVKKAGGIVSYDNLKEFELLLPKSCLVKELSIEELVLIHDIGKKIHEWCNSQETVTVKECRELIEESLKRCQEGGENKQLYCIILTNILYDLSMKEYTKQLKEIDCCNFLSISDIIRSNTFLASTQKMHFLFPKLFQGAQLLYNYTETWKKQSQNDEQVYQTFLEDVGSKENVKEVYGPQLAEIKSRTELIHKKYYLDFLELYGAFSDQLPDLQTLYGKVKDFYKRVCLKRYKLQANSNLDQDCSVIYPLDFVLKMFPTAQEFAKLRPFDTSLENYLDDDISAVVKSFTTLSLDEKSPSSSEMSIPKKHENKKKKKRGTKSLSHKTSTARVEEKTNIGKNELISENNNSIPDCNNNSSGTIKKPLANSQEPIEAVCKKLFQEYDLGAKIECSNHVWRWFDPKQNPFIDDENYSSQNLSIYKQKWLRLSHEIPVIIAHIAREKVTPYEFINKKTSRVFDAYTIGAEIQSVEFGKKRGVCTFGFDKITHELCHSYFTTSKPQEEMVVEYIKYGYLHYDFPSLSESCEKASDTQKSYTISLKDKSNIFGTQAVSISDRVTELTMPDGTSTLRVFY